jgi:uncharacterized protein (DUF2147 family)
MTVAARLLGPLCAMGLAASPALAQRATASPLGAWRTDDGSAIVRVAPCGARLCGVIERVLDPRAPPNDANNPDPSLRARSLVGIRVLDGFTRAGTGWAGGRAYDPKSGNSYRSQLALRADGRLQVTGCVLFVCRSKLWTPLR